MQLIWRISDLSFWQKNQQQRKGKTKPNRKHNQLLLNRKERGRRPPRQGGLGAPMPRHHLVALDLPNAAGKTASQGTGHPRRCCLKLVFIDSVVLEKLVWHCASTAS